MHSEPQPCPSTFAPPQQNSASGEQRPSLSLVLPAWNEREAIPRAIAEADAALGDLVEDYEIIVVDDGSSDGTAEVVAELAHSFPAVRLVRHRENRGYGAALRSGFQAATKNLVAFTDADCQFDLTELDRFLLLAERYEIVCGYRIDRKDTPLRRLYSRVYNQLVRILLPIEVRDVDCALKVFHREVVQELQITTDGFLVNSELLVEAHRRGRSIVEVGVSHRERTEGCSTVSARHIPHVLSGLLRYWWNRVQFPAAPLGVQVSLPEERRWGWLQAGLLLVAAAFLFSNLSYPLIDRDETRYAEIPREMLVSGNWIVPQLNFEPYYDKPPLVYWLCAASYALCGVSEASARLVPTLAALATLLATLGFGSRMFGSRTGFIGGVVLCLSAGFTFTSRYLLIDGVLSLLVSLSLFTAFEAIRGPQFQLRWWVLSAIFCGLGFLAKGPVALALLLPPVWAFGWLAGSQRRIRWWQLALTVGVVAGIAFPWLYAVSARDPEFLPEFFYRHNLRRFAGEFHAKPFWFYVPVLLVAGHPWSFLSLPLTRFMLSRNASRHHQRPPALGFLTLWSGWCFAFFSLSACKLPTYLMPAAPALSLIAAHFLHRSMQQNLPNPTAWFAPLQAARLATATTALAGLGFLGYAWFERLELSHSSYLWLLFWMGVLAAALSGFARRTVRARGAAPAGRVEVAWGATAAAAFALALMVMHGIVPAYSRHQTVLGAASPLQKHLELTAGSPIATVAHEFSEVPFYLRRADIPNLAADEGERLAGFITSHREATLIVERGISDAQLLEPLPAGSQLHWLAERGPARILRAVAPAPPERTAPRKADRVAEHPAGRRSPAATR